MQGSLNDHGQVGHRGQWAIEGQCLAGWPKRQYIWVGGMVGQLALYLHGIVGNEAS